MRFNFNTYVNELDLLGLIGLKLVNSNKYLNLLTYFNKDFRG